MTLQNNVTGAEILRPAFLDAMSRVCGAANLITTNGPSGKGGFVATAMCSVTDTPPTLLVCMNRSSQQSNLFLDNGQFCVNVLSHEDRSLAEAFAGKVKDMGERYELAGWQQFASGNSGVIGALAAIDCRLSSHQQVGSHNVLFGEVMDVFLSDQNAPLLYHNRAFGTFANQ